MPGWRRILLVTLLGAAQPAVARAQAGVPGGVPPGTPATRTISGLVRVAGAPGASATGVVQLTDSAGRTIAVIRPDAAGAFTFRSVTSGRYRLRALRLGFQPVEVLVEVGTQDVALGTIDGPTRPIALPAVRVRGTQDCVDAREEGETRDLWRLFEVALATQVADARGPRPPERWSTYEQRIDARSGMVTQVRVTDGAAGAAGGFQPAPAAALAELGFVTEDAAGFTYFLPDAATLLAPEFLERYCFRAVRATGAIALGFRAARARTGRTDVAGELVFSADGTRIELVRFDYVGLPSSIEGATASGLVRFATQHGRVAISSWWVDMPVVALHRPGSSGASSSRSSLGAQRSVVARRRVGAHRVALAPCAGCALEAETAVAGLRLERDGASDDASAIARLIVGGTSVGGTSVGGTTTGSRAEGAVIPWPPGRYATRVATEWMAALGVEQASELSVADSAGPTPLRFGYAREESLRHACAATRASVALGGTVRQAHGAPVSAAAVVVRSATAGGETDRVTATDARGVWFLCLPASERAIHVWAIADGGGSAADRADPPGPVAEPAGAGRAESAIDPAGSRVTDLVLHEARGTTASAVTPSILEVRVRAPSGEPVADVEVRVESARRPAAVRRTDAQGLAVFLVPDSGAAQVSARRIGAKPARLSVRVAGGRNAIGLALATDGVARLDTVRVFGDRRVSARLDGFETRVRERRPNRVLLAEQLRRHSRLTDALINVPGVFVVDSSGVRQARATRTTAITTGSGRTIPGCRLRVFLDGVPQPPEVSIDFGPSPTQLHGVEVYLTVGRIPPEFGGTLGPGECGVLLLWSADGGRS